MLKFKDRNLFGKTNKTVTYFTRTSVQLLAEHIPDKHTSNNKFCMFG